MRKSPIVVVSTAILFICAGCTQPALLYGERNSLHVASVQINDNVAEPLRLNVAFRRTIAMKAPSVEGANGEAKGEAVSVFSSFDLGSDDNDKTTIIDPIEITTKFASGIAAQNIASNPSVVAQILGVTLAPDSPAVAQMKEAAIECVMKKLTPAQIQTLATQLKLPPTRQNPSGVKEYIFNMSEMDLINLKSSLVSSCQSLA